MIRHTSMTADTLGNVDMTLPDGELLRFAGIDLAEEFLSLLDNRIDESNCRQQMAVGDPADAGQRDPAVGDGPATGSAIVTTGLVDPDPAPVGRKVGRCANNQAPR